MDLFTPVVEESCLHPNFRRVLAFARRGERRVVQEWAEDFPDRDGKMVKEFQTTFNSSFWEVYLHALLRGYGFTFDWSRSRPDFIISKGQRSIVVEAATANASTGAVPEWEKPDLVTEQVRNKEFNSLNTTAMIRLSNAIDKKIKKYRESYAKLDHVAGNPYVIAVAPFEQPDFQFQYDRPMRALLYDDYVDEETYFKNPGAFPEGPPSTKLGYIKKPNGAEVELGLFNDLGAAEVSAIIFSCAATWGKAVAMSQVPQAGLINSVWGIEQPPGNEVRTFPIGKPCESIFDGVQVFHNPHALRPIDPSVFRQEGVVQHYLHAGQFMQEGYSSALRFRLTASIAVLPGEEREA